MNENPKAIEYKKTPANSISCEVCVYSFLPFENSAKGLRCALHSNYPIPKKTHVKMQLHVVKKRKADNTNEI